MRPSKSTFRATQIFGFVPFAFFPPRAQIMNYRTPPRDAFCVGNYELMHLVLVLGENNRSRSRLGCVLV
jgi:hypothetical protein